MEQPVGDDGSDHRRTLEVYERCAREWAAAREPAQGDPTLQDSMTFSEQVEPAARGRPVRAVDLGCGPGWHLPSLPAGTIALDGAGAMLRLVPRHAPWSPRVMADLTALPFATGALDAAWANRSYVHLRRSAVPMALRDLHRSLRVGALVRLEVFEGDDEHVRFRDDDVPGRFFSTWPEPLLAGVLMGAGFSIELVERARHGTVDHLVVWARRERTLADTVGADMRLLLVGLNPSLVAADAGVAFHRAGNRAWPALIAAGLATVDRDPVDLLLRHRIGMTDLVKRASARADGLAPDELAEGTARLGLLCSWLRPDAVCVLGLTGWRRAIDPDAVGGLQPRRLGGRPVYLMGNPSGANAHAQLPDVVRGLRAAAELADTARDPQDSRRAAP